MPKRLAPTNPGSHLDYLDNLDYLDYLDYLDDLDDLDDLALAPPACREG